MRRSVTITVHKGSGKEILAATNRRWGGFTLPGGKVEPGEDIETAAWRELQEETGLVPSAMKYLGSSLFDNPFTDDAPFLVSHFEAIIDKPNPSQMEEGTEPIWMLPHHFIYDDESIFKEHYYRILKLGVLG